VLECASDLPGVSQLNDDGIYRCHADPERSVRDIHRTFLADTPKKGGSNRPLAHARGGRRRMGPRCCAVKYWVAGQPSIMPSAAKAKISKGVSNMEVSMSMHEVPHIVVAQETTNDR
jgi:hypothetical protein